MQIKCFTSNSQKPRGAVLLLHGLNNSEESFSEIKADLLEQGFHIVQPALSGHYAESDIYHASAADWIQETKNALHSLKSTHPDLPHFAVGYSLGGALLIHAIQSIELHGLVLLAPACAITPIMTLAQVFLPLRHLRVAIPSLTPRGFRVKALTPISAYGETHKILKSIQTIDASINKIPTTVVFHEKDELVSATIGATWLKQNGLSRWKCVVLKTEFPRERKLPHHLLLSPRATGVENWKRLRTLIQERFSDGTNETESIIPS